MATKVVMVDDIDGYDGEDVAKRDFEVAGTQFTIDLGDANHKRLTETLEILAPYLEKAVVVKAAGRSRKSNADVTPRLRGYTNTDVREWAKREGVEVSVRGKIADEVYEQFIAAHPDARPGTDPQSGPQLQDEPRTQDGSQPQDEPEPQDMRS
ncbi:Lsr2 protein [Thermomonospora echinospora]|uniref:Lsr2 protein n=1 Tax=Thermomonospora echinospora TaxID=1992 RepID=A0A1H5YJF0_9ACTN|nr:Lsr2 family protein [Thermomonospora echinospora]SEG23840.1 Lsr2 protein [Thermomonospora echinospora]